MMAFGTTWNSNQFLAELCLQFWLFRLWCSPKEKNNRTTRAGVKPPAYFVAFLGFENNTEQQGTTWNSIKGKDTKSPANR